jgi:uncharacterized membrane protein
MTAAALGTSGIPTGPAFDVLLIAHVACVLIGLGTVVVSGTQASRLASALRPAGRASEDPGVATSVRAGSSRPPQLATPRLSASAERSFLRYYAPGPNWAGRTLHGVPILGFVLLALSHGAYALDEAWVMSGLALWVVAAGCAEGLLWPCERRIGILLAPGADAGPTVEGGFSQVGRECRNAQLVAALVVLVLLAAVVLMVAKP